MLASYLSLVISRPSLPFLFTRPARLDRVEQTSSLRIIPRKICLFQVFPPDDMLKSEMLQCSVRGEKQRAYDLFLCRKHCLGVACHARVTQVTKTSVEKQQLRSRSQLTAARPPARAALFSRYSAASRRVPAPEHSETALPGIRRAARWCEGRVMTLQGARVTSICRCLGVVPLPHWLTGATLPALDWP